MQEKLYFCSMILHPLHIQHLEDIPEKMNNPFDYTPHPLCITACKELQRYLTKRKDWQEEINQGKMFGVLIVDASQNCNSVDYTNNPQIGYLAAYSGQICGRSDWDDFVPAVFDYLQTDGYFKTHEAEITNINQAINQLENDKRMQEAKVIIQSLHDTRQKAILDYQVKIKEAKAKRDARRKEAMLSGKGLTKEEEQAMIKESQFMKAELRRIKKALAEKTTLEAEYEDYIENIKRLRQWLFSQFRMLNQERASKDLL